MYQYQMGSPSLLVRTDALHAHYRYSRSTLCKHEDTFIVKIKLVNISVFLKHI